ncbi:cytochrome P450 [Sphingomonas sp. PB4P5]|uniref:cytochrome P450 n=1 Tax=Parasphingomonas puruogangriensis TaxID=3096155 RepID=UPI002FC6C5F3
MAMLPTLFGWLRKVRPVLRLGSTYLITRHDDVRTVFANDQAFGAPYAAKLDIIMGGAPFILGMADGDPYRAGLASLRRVVRRDDLPLLGARVTAQAEAIVAEADGRLDVVDTLVRRIAFDFMATYLGVPEPANGELRVWGTRLFEFQFVASDAPLLAEVNRIAPLMRAHVQQQIEARRGSSGDDVIARALRLQAAGEPGFSDTQIRSDVVGLLVGGPPQPPMVLPQALEQLLRRPDALAAAQAAARADDDRLLSAYIMEAMRFDPLAPWMPRVARAARSVGEGKSGRIIPAGATVLASIASAMRDERRVPDPSRFDATRPAEQYLHFGYGVHQCFGLEINRATLHLMLKPLLKRDRLRRAPGRAGRLQKNGAFASSLVVEFD